MWRNSTAGSSAAKSFIGKLVWRQRSWAKRLRCGVKLLKREAAVRADCGVDLSHDADGFFQRNCDFLVVLQVIPTEFASFAVLEPLFEHLIAADMEFPDLARHAFEILERIDPHAPVIIRITDLLDHVASLPGENGDHLSGLRRLQEVKRPQSRPLFNERSKKVTVARERQAREIALQKFRVALAIGGRVEHRVHAVEHVLWAEGPGIW